MSALARAIRIRRLSGAEIEIWRRVAATVTPRDGAALPAQPETPPAPAAPSPPPAERPPAVAPRAYPAASYTPPVSMPKLMPKPPPVGLERRYKRKVAIGRVAVEGLLDLHGMTQAQAHSALNHFIVRSQREGARLVIVVTGKGMRDRYAARPEAVEPGVLRRAVPSWLRDGALRQIVIGFEEASIGHGGAGALYVRLRRASAAP